jgi:hypothetical protein
MFGIKKGIFPEMRRYGTDRKGLAHRRGAWFFGAFDRKGKKAFVRGRLHCL